MNDVWKNPGKPIGVTRMISIYGAIMNTESDNRYGWRRRDYLGQLHVVISSFIQDKHKNIEGDNGEDQSPAEFLGVCATTTQLYEMRVNSMLRLLRAADRGFAQFVIPLSADELPCDPVSDILDREWNILIPRFRERVEQIAWQIQIGEHDGWKPGGKEWQNIEKFYGGLGQRMTMTRLKLPAILGPVPRLRKVYIVTRPVDASGRNLWQYRGRETEQYNSVTADIMQAASRCIPIPCQHWALMVEEYNGSTTWELGVVEGRIKIEENQKYYPEPSHTILVGYTAMSNDEISASAGEVRKSMGDSYSFSTWNCQHFCNALFQSIRVSHTMSDAFLDLHALPDDCVVPIVKRRLELIPMAIYYDLLKVEKSQLMPMFFGTLYTRALIVATTSLLIYTYINLRITIFFLQAGVLVGWSPFAQRHTNLYPLSAKRDPDPRRLRYLYYVGNTRKRNASGQSVAQTVGSQQRLFGQSGRIVEIDNEDDMNGGLEQAVANLNRGHSARKRRKGA